MLDAAEAVDGKGVDEGLLMGFGRTRPQKGERAELQAARSTHPDPSAAHLVHVMKRLPTTEVTVLRRLVSSKLVPLVM